MNRPSGPVRIAHLTDVHSALDVRIYHKECLTLADAGFQVALVAPACDPPPAGVQFLPIDRPKGRLSRMVRGPLRAWRQARRAKAEVYHLHDPELIPVGFLLKLAGKRVIYDAHEDLPSQVMHKQYLGPVGRRVAAGGARVLCWLAGQCFDGIVAAVPAIAERFPPRKTWLVRNYPKAEELTLGACPTPPSQRPPQGAYIGGISSSRGLFDMLDAAAALGPRHGFRLVLAGAFQPESLMDAAKAHPGWAFTEFRGWLDRGGVARLLAESRCGLVALHPTPAFVESLPVKLFEYMATGTPVAASRFPAWEALLGEEVVFVEPSQPASLAAAIESLLLDPARADALASRAREAVLKDYNWASESQALKACYATVLKRQAAEPLEA